MTPRPRVLHVVSSLGTYGAEQLVMQLSRRLPGAGIETAVLTIYTPDEAIAERQRELGIPLFDMHRGRRLELEMLARMVAAIRSWKPHVVHAHTHYGKYWGRAAALAARVPTIVFSEHGNTFESQRAYRAANAVLHPRTAAFVTFTNGQRERLAAAESVPLERISVVPNGIEAPARTSDRACARARFGFAADAFVMLHVARLDALKNHRLALEALALVPQHERARMLLVLAGDGPSRDELERLARERGIDGNVRFLGFSRDVEALMGAADVLVSTSLSEAMPMTLIEAMFSELPIVTTPWVGSRDVLADGALGAILADYEPATFARAMIDAANDGARMRAVAHAARSYALDTHAIARTVSGHAELYERLLT